MLLAIMSTKIFVLLEKLGGVVFFRNAVLIWILLGMLCWFDFLRKLC